MDVGQGLRKVLLLSMRHLGDSVILAGFVNALRASYPDLRVDVLGRPGLESVLRPLCYFQEYIEIEIPIFGHHKRSLSLLKQALGTMLDIRRRRYDGCINLMGDVRENVIGWLAGTGRNVAPVWPEDHIFRNKVRAHGASAFLNVGLPIPTSRRNFYNAMDQFTAELGLTPLHWFSGSRADVQQGAARTIALHPGASHHSRHWPVEKWRTLVRELRGRGFRIQLLGAPSERSYLEVEFAKEISTEGVEVLVGTPHEFFANLSGANLLVGMDSFSVHAAHAMGVKTIILNGPADPEIMTPPGAPALSAGKGCPAYPCYNRPSCLGTAGEYLCVRDIEVETVVRTVMSTLGSRAE